ncbi:unnamed protein product, partial [Meganyctiphanes norvegica]
PRRYYFCFSSMARYFSLLLVGVLVTVAISNVCAQTFNYSRGWTNGKRSEPALQPKMAEANAAVQHMSPMVVQVKRRMMQQSLEDHIRNLEQELGEMYELASAM